jgi:hypothetical protein
LQQAAQAEHILVKIQHFLNNTGKLQKMVILVSLPRTHQAAAAATEAAAKAVAALAFYQTDFKLEEVLVLHPV